jgi:type II secretory pathway component PulF
MNYDEFAFFNQQLAAMLRDGIPLEGALKQLLAGMRSGSLRREIEELEADLAKGAPLKEALSRRSLPAFYIRMVEIGARSNDLPGMLTMLADYYQRSNALLTRLKGLMVYPLIVIVVAFGLTLAVSMVFTKFLSPSITNLFQGFVPGSEGFESMASWAWLPPIVLGLAALCILGMMFFPLWREKLRWRIPAFREASLAQVASALALMLKNGVPLPEALALAEMLEENTPARQTLTQWRQSVESGKGKPSQWTTTGRPFPQLFVWLVQSGGEDPAAGFQKASEIYAARAAYRTELALYGALPISILLLGQMILWQVFPLLRTFIVMMNTIGGSGDGPRD